MPGGAGNVVRNLTALGAAVAFISVVGDDQAGLGPDRPDRRPAQRRALAAGAGRPHHHAEDPLLCRPASNCCAPTARRPRRSSRGLPNAWCGSRATRWRRPRVTVLSDYRKGLLTRRGAGAADRRGAARLARPVIVDPKGADYSRYAGADIIMPNRARSCRGHRHAGGQRGRDRRRRDRASPAPRLRRGAGDPRQ